MKKTEKKRRADCQRIELHSSANLFKVRLVDVLLFGGEHMSTTAVPPWIGSDCVRACCISGSRAKSERSELSHFWYECCTWFTCLFFFPLANGGHSLRPKLHLTWKIEFFSEQRYRSGDCGTFQCLVGHDFSSCVAAPLSLVKETSCTYDKHHVVRIW